MKSQTVWQRTLGFLGSKPVIIETPYTQLTSDAGLLPMLEFDEARGSRTLRRTRGMSGARLIRFWK